MFRVDKIFEFSLSKSFHRLRRRKEKHPRKTFRSVWKVTKSGELLIDQIKSTSGTSWLRLMKATIETRKSLSKLIWSIFSHCFHFNRRLRANYGTNIGARVHNAVNLVALLPRRCRLKETSFLTFRPARMKYAVYQPLVYIYVYRTRLQYDSR